MAGIAAASEGGGRGPGRRRRVRDRREQELPDPDRDRRRVRRGRRGLRAVQGEGDHRLPAAGEPRVPLGDRRAGLGAAARACCNARVAGPRRPITTNVTGEYYPTGEGAVDAIIDLLAQQISSPVEWTAQMERMYEDGGRVFVEVGPKRALSGFTVSILKRRPHRALYTNHPKRGGVESFRDTLAQLLVLGRAGPRDPAADERPRPVRAGRAAAGDDRGIDRLHRAPHHPTEAAPDVARASSGSSPRRPGTRSRSWTSITSSRPTSASTP